MHRSVPILLCLLLLAACGSRPADEHAAKAPPPAQKTVLDDQLKALQKAKGVEKQLQDEKDKTDQAIDDQGG